MIQMLALSDKGFKTAITKWSNILITSITETGVESIESTISSEFLNKP